jgi:serine/threonine protein kinase
MGRVVEAYDTHLQRTVALKEVLPKMANIDRRFQREVRITARLEHASIVPLYDSGRLADGRPYYVMRKVTGKPLDQVIARARTHEARIALLPNMLSAIDAIAHAHKRGVIHRDLKPQNILVGELGETVVIDWGLAKVLGDGDEPVHDSLEPRLPSAADSLQTQVGSVFGTPGFMAPEQARGDDLGPQGDVYALGATLYQVIVGKPPFGGTSATDVISSTLRHRLEPVARAAPGTPPELVTIVEKALAFEPENRYPDAGALAEDVRRFLTGQLVASHQYTPRQRVSRFVRRHRAALTVAALAFVGIAALAVVSIRSIVHERDTATSASAEAGRQRAYADQRARESRERADQLLLLHSRSLLEINPTQAMRQGSARRRSRWLVQRRCVVSRGECLRRPT